MMSLLLICTFRLLLIVLVIALVFNRKKRKTIAAEHR